MRCWTGCFHFAIYAVQEVCEARACVEYAASGVIYVAGSPAQFEFSTFKRIERSGLESEKPNHVLVVTVYNAIYPITVRVIHQVSFSKLLLVGDGGIGASAKDEEKGRGREGATINVRISVGFLEESNFFQILSKFLHLLLLIALNTLGVLAECG